MATKRPVHVTCGSRKLRKYSGSLHPHKAEREGRYEWTSPARIFITEYDVLFFYVRVTVHRNKFLYNNTNIRINFPNLFLSIH